MTLTGNSKLSKMFTKSVLKIGHLALHLHSAFQKTFKIFVKLMLGGEGNGITRKYYVRE